MLENQIDLHNANNTEAISSQIEKSNTNNNDIARNNEEWKKDTTLVMKGSTVSGLMENRMSRNQKVRLRFFPAKIKDIYHYIRIMSSYILAQTMHHINLGKLF